MANPMLFRSLVGGLVPAAGARNGEGAPAYQRTPQQALAQFASTGCLNATFYASAEQQLETVLALVGQVTPEFVARAAVYCRERGHMKDMPALLLAALSRRDPRLMDQVFDRVIDSPRMLRTFVQIVRSGATGRKSLGSAPRRCVRRWLDQRADAALFAASVGNAPSLADIVMMVHPKPGSREREALYGYLIGREVNRELLPAVVRQFEAFKAGDRPAVPDVPFQMLSALELSQREWAGVARQASWQTVRMNLNTFTRHGVFDEPQMTEHVAARLRDASEIARARVFPYQLLAACGSVDEAVPGAVRAALEDAMELAIAHVPSVDGRVYVCPDVSGSMQSPITGHRKGATTTVRCVDAAALISAAMLRRNPTAEVLPFNDAVVRLRLSAGDTVATNARRLAAAGGESWVDAAGTRGTATMREWSVFRARNPRARLVLIDLQPSSTTQAADREDVLNVGGFSDRVFDLVSEFAAGRLRGDHWVGQIESVTL
jgi:60 kDa SS-A/Ro ribonucleoprotein